MANPLLFPLFAGVTVLSFGWLAVFYEYSGCTGTTSESAIDHVGSNVLLLNSASVLLPLAVLCFLPAALALCFSLMTDNKGYAYWGRRSWSDS
jgi:hypothetical protein